MHGAERSWVPTLSCTVCRLCEKIIPYRVKPCVASQIARLQATARVMQLGQVHWLLPSSYQTSGLVQRGSGGLVGLMGVKVDKCRFVVYLIKEKPQPGERKPDISCQRSNLSI